MWTPLAPSAASVHLATATPTPVLLDLALQALAQALQAQALALTFWETASSVKVSLPYRAQTNYPTYHTHARRVPIYSTAT